MTRPRLQPGEVSRPRRSSALSRKVVKAPIKDVYNKINDGCDIIRHGSWAKELWCQRQSLPWGGIVESLVDKEVASLPNSMRERFFKD